MRFDLVSIFPRYFDVLDLSLLGRAKDSGRLDVHSHDLRQWAEGKHRSVDDSPAGGGAGMVMRPDVWGRALDEVLVAPREEGPRQVLAIPTPSGVPLTQRVVEDLATADHIVVACGRYEGLDARIAEHYRAFGVEVLEYSLGDYVLNGGEVAAIVLVEAVARLLDGVIGNPESLVEESHSSAGLLEYPAYTLPRQWRGMEIPEVLRSGDHAKIARWRRQRALEKTAAVRPDLIADLNPRSLDWRDRKFLAELGWILAPRPTRVRYREAVPQDLGALALLAARTFPDACPDYISESDKAVFVGTHLSEAAFHDYLANPDYLVVVAEAETEPPTLAAYALVARAIPPDMGHAPASSAYLSKCYTDADFRGSGVSAGLVEVTVGLTAKRWDSPAMALATHIGNKRASTFYRRSGFKKVGRRTFMVGEARNTDDVFVRQLR